MNDLIVAVDLGGTNIRAARCEASGRILKQTAHATLAPEGPESVFSRIALGIREVMGDWSRVRGIGLGAPGPLDPWHGVIYEAPNLPGMTDFPMKARLEKEFRVPTFVGNDANLAALGEHRYGAGRGVAHMIYLTISTGIGGGIIAGNRLFLGWRGFAGEVGHQTLEAHGPPCNCGNVGCLEALAAGPAIARDARNALRAGRDSSMRATVNGNLDLVTGAVVTQAARAGDALAQEILGRAGFYIGLGLVNLLHNFDTQLFVLGGGVAIHAWDFLYPSVLAVLDEHAMPSMRKDVRIVHAELGDEVGLLGAMALVIDQTSQ
jgi:glucokinase